MSISPKKVICRPILLDIFALVSGCLLPLAFAPLNLYGLAFFVPGFLLLTLLTASPSRAYYRTWLFWVGGFGVGVSWVFISIHLYGHTSFFLALSLTILFVFFIASYNAIQGWLFRTLFPKSTTLNILIGFPCCWALIDFFRSWFLTGFPWLLLGNTQTDSVLSAFAPIVGVYGLSFIVAFISSLWVNLFLVQKRFLVLVINIIVTTAIFAGAHFLHEKEWTTSTGKAISFAYVQGNIAQEMKWNRNNLQQNLETYISMSLPLWKNRIVIWPEAAIPLPLNYASDLIDEMTSEAQKNHSTLITGIPIQTTKNDEYYNGLVMVGMEQGQYIKRHLVPFGEFLPLENWLRGMINFFNIPMSNLQSGPLEQPLLKIDGITLAAYICYEIGFSNELIATLQNANAILTISDDSWFGHSWAGEQQFQMTRMRALEVQRPIIVATNSGISGLIEPNGNVAAQSPSFVPATLIGKLHGRSGNTPLMNIGPPWIITALVLLLFLAWINTRKI